MNTQVLKIGNFSTSETILVIDLETSYHSSPQNKSINVTQDKGKKFVGMIQFLK